MENQNTEARFAICINDGGYVDDLKVRTVYQILPDESAARSNYVRVIDETGEDYLYPASPDEPDFQIRVRAAKHEPDMFSVNKNMKMIEELFS